MLFPSYRACSKPLTSAPSPHTGRHRPRRHSRPFFILKPNVLYRPIDDQTNIQLPSVPVPVRWLYLAITPRTTGPTPCCGPSRRPPQLIDVSKRGVESPDSDPVMCVYPPRLSTSLYLTISSAGHDAYSNQIPSSTPQ